MRKLWLSELTPDQLKLLHDLADAIRTTGIKSAQSSEMAAMINQEVERRANIQTGNNPTTLRKSLR
jgi:hypothetical protein